MFFYQFAVELIKYRSITPQAATMLLLKLSAILAILFYTFLYVGNRRSYLLKPLLFWWTGFVLFMAAT